MTIGLRPTASVPLSVLVVKMSTAQQEPAVAGQRNIEVLCEKVHAHLP